MLAAVGPFAIEAGLVAATADRTHVRIHNVNTGKLIDATVATPGGRVTYEGDARIDGVPGTAAPVELSFPNAAGARTGRLLPTGWPVDRIEGIDVTCIDAAMPVVLVRAADLGWTGREAPSDFVDSGFRARLEYLRIEAGRRMGFPDLANMVIPKPVLIASAGAATLNTRYFMPHDCHSALAVTGAVAIATACVTPGTIAAEMVGPLAPPVSITLGHPSGQLVVRLEPGRMPGAADSPADLRGARLCPPVARASCGPGGRSRRLRSHQENQNMGETRMQMQALVGPEHNEARKPFYRMLYVQVLIGVTLGVLTGYLWPDFGAALKPLGDGFVKLVKMMIAPIVSAPSSAASPAQ